MLFLPRISKDPEERRNEILDAAEALFSSKGFQQTAVSDIVKAVGVAQGTFYYYFKSKDEIADALLERQLDHIIVSFKRSVSDPKMSAYEKIASLIALDLFDYNHENGFGPFFNALHLEENTFLHQKLVVRMIKSFAPFLAQIIDQGKMEGTFKTTQNSQYLAEFLFTGYQFWHDCSVFKWKEEELYHRLKSFGGMVEALLVTEPGMFDIERIKERFASQK